eukprot:1151836-Pelagomonas_calceolata.AAC.4
MSNSQEGDLTGQIWGWEPWVLPRTLGFLTLFLVLGLIRGVVGSQAGASDLKQTCFLSILVCRCLCPRILGRERNDEKRGRKRKCKSFKNNWSRMLPVTHQTHISFPCHSGEGHSQP